jgi:aspartyl-tRNA(Asn)/glutamyl-tRNA(Gln) amidotransferase subunit A
MSPDERWNLKHAVAAADSPAADAVFIHRLDPLPYGGANTLSWAGIPVTVKDNFDIAGLPTTAGSRLLLDAPPATADAQVVRRLRRMGAVILGRTNMTEFAYSGLGLNPHFGTPRNPAFKDSVRIPGGSSSGAAVSVALGIAPFAIGTDTGGSVRIPAAWCGLVGFKPTADTISREGVLPLSTSLDSVGVIATCVDDCAAVFNALRAGGPASRRRSDAPLAGRRLARVRGYVDEDLESDVEGAIVSALNRLVAAGAIVEELRIPELSSIARMNEVGTLTAAESYDWHREYLRTRTHDYDPRVRTRIERGAAMTVASYESLVAARREFASGFSARIARYDAVLWPTVPMVAPELHSLSDSDAYNKCNLRALRNSTIVNLADGCAVSLPCSAGDAPVGLTVAAAYGRDDELLAIARSIEAALGIPPPPNAVRLRNWPHPSN